MRKETKILIERDKKDFIDYIKGLSYRSKIKGLEYDYPEPLDENYFRPPGVGDAKIKQMEEELGLKFSDDYTEFLRCYGAFVCNGFIIHGYAPNSTYEKDKTVVEETEFYRSCKLAAPQPGWPGILDWYIISSDGWGGQIGCKPDGSVWLADYRCGEQLKLGDSFDDFLYKVLTETVFEDGEQVTLPPRMSECDEEEVVQLLLEWLLYIEFGDVCKQDEQLSFEKQFVETLQKLSSDAKHKLVKIAVQHAEQHSGDKKKLLENLADIIGS